VPLALRMATADEAPATSSTFAYKHNPIYNAKAMEDVVVNPDAVYGFSPNPDSGSLTGYATYDWTDPEVVATARERREAYLAQDQQLYDEVLALLDKGAGLEEVARAASAKRNELRLAAYDDDPEGLAVVKARNLEKYGNEEGPTADQLYEKYGSWEAVLDSAVSTNPGMDACCGLYDDNWERYVYFGQIAQYTVDFDTAGHGEAPESQKVYAGELATEPAAPEGDDLVFDGWTVKDSEELFDFSSVITKDLTLVASWSSAATRMPGTASLDVVVADDAPVAGVTLSAEAVELLTQEDQIRLDDGEDARVWLDVKATTASDDLKASMLAFGQEALGNTLTPLFVDVDLYKRLTDDDADTHVTELGEAVTLVIKLAGDQVPSDAASRTWYVGRAHDDKIVSLDATYDANDNTVSFSTDGFSTFMVAYGAADSADPGDSTDPGDTDGQDTPATPSTSGTTPSRTSTQTHASVPASTITRGSSASTPRAAYATRTSSSPSSAARTLAATGDSTSTAPVVAIICVGAMAVLIGRQKMHYPC
ncbi:MAG: InlB B-repeat-containing protein, partial [Atopobiaceae bacterium]|nr:InlB B-repeat-containing protein [Atopobiaceae bacterium]